jgi:dethiobiotin synthetase
MRLAITGTDTGVGKTTIAVGLLSVLHDQGFRVAGMKPIETGVRRGQPKSDGMRLWDAAGQVDSLWDVSPFVFEEPVAPFVAAGQGGEQIDLSRLDAAFARLARGRQAVMVEGAGGVLCPIKADFLMLDLFARWRLELIVVAANRLGTINHTLLTIRAAEAAGLRVRGIVLNDAPCMETDPSRQSNAQVLRSLIPHVQIVRYPRIVETEGVLDVGTLSARVGLAALCMNQSPLPAARS